MKLWQKLSGVHFWLTVYIFCTSYWLSRTLRSTNQNNQAWLTELFYCCSSRLELTSTTSLLSVHTAVRTNAIQLQYNCNTRIFFMYCSCIALVRTPAIQRCNTSFLQLAENLQATCSNCKNLYCTLCLKKTSPGVCPNKGAAVRTFTVTFDCDVANQPFQILLTL